MIKTSLFFLWVISFAATFIGFLIYLISSLIPEKKIVHKKITPFFSNDKMDNLIQDADTTEQKLRALVDSLVEHHHLPEKNNGKTPKRAKGMLDMIFTLNSHRNMTDELRESMFERLREANPEYAKEFANGKK